MKTTTLVATLTAALLLSAAAYGISAVVDSPRTLMSPDDYSTAKRAIEADARAALSRCLGPDLDGREVCKAEARADEAVRKADLEASYRGTVGAAAEARLTRAKAKYEVARARCAGEPRESKLSCLRAARDEKTRALAAAKVASD